MHKQALQKHILSVQALDSEHVCLHSDTLSPTILQPMTGRVLLLYCYFHHSIFVSFHYSRVLTVSANLKDYFSFILFCMVPSFGSTVVQSKV